MSELFATIDPVPLKIIAAGCAGAFVSFVTCYFWTRSHRPKSEAPSAQAVPMPEFTQILDDLEARLADRLQQNQQQNHDQLNVIAKDLAFLQADLEWLSSEHMINQAIDLARHGGDCSDIARATGIHENDIRAIQKLRRH